MEVMTTHTFHDTDVKKVKRDGPDSVREIVLKACAENSMIISAADVVALANEFGLVVFKADAAL